jgi:hypothetical protein
MKFFQRSILAHTLALALTVVNAEETAVELGYGVRIYECDGNLEELSFDDRQVKRKGSVYRICFAPNQKAEADGVGISKIDHFTFETEHDKGTALQKAIENGADDGAVTILTCGMGDSQNVCVLDTLLAAGFYRNTGSVLGTGEASMTKGAGKVELEKWLFQAKFNFVWTGPGGEEAEAEPAKPEIASEL